MNNKEIVIKIHKWWMDEKTCSGEPHCTIEECDLCVNCYLKLLNEFGYTLEYGNPEKLISKSTKENKK